LRAESAHSDLSPTKLFLKKPLQLAMTLKKHSTVGDGATSKDKCIAIAGGINPLSSLNLSSIVEETAFAPLQGVTGDIYPPSSYEGQLLQIFADMKEEMTKQQALFDRKQAAHDQENAAHEWKESNHPYGQLLAQITTF